jgi:hypothetical protein
MGVKYAHKFFRDAGLFDDLWSPEDLCGQDKPVLVDLFGSFYPQILSACKANNFIWLATWIASVLPINNTTLVVDGKPMNAKHATHIKRRDQTEKSVKKLEKLAFILEEAAAKGCGRASKSTWKTVDRLTRRTVVVNEEVKDSLVAALQGVGFNVVRAAGEADVYIGKHATGEFLTFWCLVSKDMNL